MLNQGEYGELYKNADITVDITTVNVGVEIATLDAGESRYTKLNGTTGRIRLAKGKHLVRAEVSLTAASGKALALSIAKNGTTQAKTTQRVTSDNAPEHVSLQGIIESDGDDEVSVLVVNTTDNADVTIKAINLVALGLNTSPPRPGSPS